MSYQIIPLNEMLQNFTVGEVKEILSTFSCPLNKDVERFLHSTSIEMEKQGISRTYLVYTSYKGENALAAYFTLTNKFITIPVNSHVLTANMKRRIRKFATFNQELNRYEISAPLIGQLSKNNRYAGCKLISGDELLSMACDKIREAQAIIGGKFVYLECEDRLRLVEFYERNKFFVFAKRALDRDDRSSYRGSEFLQMLKYL